MVILQYGVFVENTPYDRKIEPMSFSTATLRVVGGCTRSENIELRVAHTSDKTKIAE